MYEVHPYSMYGFLQLITDGNQTNNQEKGKTRAGREEKTRELLKEKMRQ